MEQDFTNREIKHYFDEIQKSLERTETQVIKTNGRVTVIEMWKESLTARIATLITILTVLWVGFKEFFLNK